MRAAQLPSSKNTPTPCIAEKITVESLELHLMKHAEKLSVGL